VFFADNETRGELAEQSDHATPLTERGWAEARELGRPLRSTFGSFDLVFHSGYTRSADTVEALLEAWPPELRSRIEVRAHLFLRERDAGHCFNFTAAEAEAAFPWLQGYWQVAGPFFARPPGGESLADVAMRVHLFLESAKDELAGKSVMIVTHSGTLQMLRFWLEGWTHEDVLARLKSEPVSNCDVIVYRAGDGGRLARCEIAQAFAARTMSAPR
jgi:broad specificity phosphatase PhoE